MLFRQLLNDILKASQKNARQSLKSRRDARNFSSRSGITLVELMIAAAIIGFIVLILSQMTNITSISTANFNRSSDVNYLVGEVTQKLSNPYNCIETFGHPDDGPQDFTPDSIVRLVNIDRTVTPPNVTVPADGRAHHIQGHAQAQPYGPSQLFVERYELKELGPGRNTYLEITVAAKGVGGGNIGSAEIVRKVPLQVEWRQPVTTTPPIMTACRSLSQATTELWSRGAGTDIYYMGTVGVGTRTPSQAHALNISGDFLVDQNSSGEGGNIKAHSFYYDSDQRLKQRIETIRNPLGTINNLRGVSFDWKSNHKHDFGFIAQEVEKELPELVSKDADGQLSVDYVKVLPFLVEALKQQQKDIEELQHEVQKLKQ